MRNDVILGILKQNRVRLALIILAFAFAYWVWPTIWRYDSMRGLPVRTNRFTSHVEQLGSNGWVPDNEASEQTPASTAAPDDAQTPDGSQSP